MSTLLMAKRATLCAVLPTLVPNMDWYLMPEDTSPVSVLITVVVVAVSAVALAVVDVAGVRPRVSTMLSRLMASLGLAL